MTRVIFLDFDGVLNSAEWMKGFQERNPNLFLHSFERTLKELNPQQVQMMSKFAEEMDASVVISSSWRILHPLGELIAILTANGWGETPIIGMTPRVHSGFRGDEVNLWLAENTFRGKVENHVIFDDDGDFHPDQPLVQTDWEQGLQECHIEHARTILR